jgi:tetratricopeptide (TPR) repeat protein
MGATSVSGRLPPEAIQRIVRQNYGRFRACYERGLLRNPRIGGRVTARFKIRGDGSVVNIENGGSSLPDADVVRCVLDAFGALSFPQPEGGTVTVVYPILFSPEDAPAGPTVWGQSQRATHAPPAPQTPPVPPTPPVARQPEREWPHAASPYTGVYGEVMDALAREERAFALSAARKFRAGSPGDVMGLLALGKALEANKAPVAAARAYGSVIDLFPQRADLRRYAAVELEHLATPNALQLARDSYEKALADRPDHVTTYRFLAYAHAQARDHRRAFETLEAALGKLGERPRPGVDRIVREDLGLIAALWIKAEPTAAATIRSRLARAGGQLEERPSLRFILSWETDANDVDLHVYDERGGHAYYASQDLASGGSLYADVTSGYGPEAFTVRGSSRAKRYNLQAHYYAQGPMGFGMGSLQIVNHDGRGTLRVEQRPFVVMMDQAYADLGTYSPS